MSKCIAGLLAAVAQLVFVPIVHAFPDGSRELSASELKALLADKVFAVSLKDGTKWRLEFRGKYIYIDTNRGFRGDGQWATEASSLCSELRGRTRTCNEARLHEGVLHLKRDTGEIVQYLPQ